MRTWLVVLAALLLLIPALAMADLDVSGNLIGEIEGSPWLGPGDPCGTCPAPATDDRGVAFKNGDMWVINQTGLLHHLQNCVVISSLGTQAPSPTFGLGYDSNRDLWIVTNPGTDMVYQVNQAGAVVNSWPTPSSGPVGAAYDPSRDLYWITDFAANQITSINPNTGLPGPAINVPGGSRLAGTGYDPATDVLFYHGRDQAMSYCISAATGQLLAQFPVPAGGANNGQGAAIAPDGNGWLSHFEQPTIYCVEKGGATPVERSTWGGIKSVYEKATITD